MYLIERFSCSLDFFENTPHGGGPNEALRVIVVGVDEIGNGVDEFVQTAEHAASNAFVGQFAEPAFDQVQPRGTGGREMHVESRMALKPSLNLGVLMGRVVVHDKVKVEMASVCASMTLRNFIHS